MLSNKVLRVDDHQSSSWLERDVRFGEISYPFHVVSGDSSWSELIGRLAGLDSDRFFLVADDGVPPQIVSRSRECLAQVAPTTVLPVPNNEKSKNIDTVDRLAETVLCEGATRSSVIVALGGGLVGNVAGLLAALLFRGIRLVHMPTTLLGMSDSVLSLKQAVNSRLGKNHLGTFHEPVLVWNNLDFLTTLPPVEIQSALCELVKNVLVICPQRYDEVAAQLRPDANYSFETLAGFIDLCVAAKTTVMCDDYHEKQSGLILEYGHTTGHAVELLTNGRFRHGHAIGVGMLVAAHISRQLGWLSASDEAAHRTLLQRNGAPTQFPDGISVDEIVSVVHRDNKRGYIAPQQGNADMVLLDALGTAHRTGDSLITHVDENLLRSALAANIAGNHHHSNGNSYTGYGPIINDISGRATTIRQIGGAGAARWKQLAYGAHLSGEWNTVEHVTLLPGSAIGEHVHNRTEEIYYILAGQAQMSVDGVERTVHAGDLITTPIGTRHGISNQSDEDMVFYVTEVYPGSGTSSPPVFIDVPKQLEPLAGYRASPQPVRAAEIALGELFSGDWQAFTEIRLGPDEQLGEYTLPAVTEVMFVVSGAAAVTVEGATYTGSSGMCVALPAGSARSIYNTSGHEDLRLLSTEVLAA